MEDPYIVEFLVNFRWILYWVAERLDPVREAEYGQLAEAAAVMMRALMSRSCAGSKDLGAVPFGVLAMAKTGYYYLLVADGVLSDGPITLHPFLTRALRDTDRNDGLSCNSERGRDHTAPMNTSTATARSTVDTRSSCTVGLRELEVASQVQPQEEQALVMLLRWLVRARVVPPEELALTLSLVDSMDLSSRSTREGGALSESMHNRASHAGKHPHDPPPLFTAHDGNQSSRSSRGDGSAGSSTTSSQRKHGVSYRRAARRLCQLRPFFLGAHLLISRCLLLHYTGTLLPIAGIVSHTSALETAGRERNDAGDSFLCQQPRTGRDGESLESALVYWLRTVVGRVRGESSRDSAAPGTGSSLRSVLREGSALDSREWRAWLAELALRNDFYDVAADGLALGLACHYYRPDRLPLTVLTPPAFLEGTRNGSGHALNTSLSPEEKRAVDAQQRNWAAVLRCAEGLGVAPCMVADELVCHAGDALQLHVLRLTQELFAVLATEAEEVVRASVELAQEEELLADHSSEPGEESTDTGKRLASAMVEEFHSPQRERNSTAASVPSQEVSGISSGPIIARRKAVVKPPSSPSIAEKEAHDAFSVEVSGFPSPPNVFDTEEDLAGDRGERDDTGASDHASTDPPLAPVAACSSSASSQSSLHPPHTVRPMVFPLHATATHTTGLAHAESPVADTLPSEDDSAPEKEPEPPRLPHPVEASAELPHGFASQSVPFSLYADQPLFTSSSTAAGVVVSGTTLGGETQSRVLNVLLDARAEGNVMEEASQVTHPVKDESTGSSQEPITNAANIMSAPSSVAAVSANVSLVDAQDSPTRLVPPSSSPPEALRVCAPQSETPRATVERVDPLVEPDPAAAAQLEAFLWEEEVQLHGSPSNYPKYSITSSMSIPVDVPESWHHSSSPRIPEAGKESFPAEELANNGNPTRGSEANDSSRNDEEAFEVRRPAQESRSASLNTAAGTDHNVHDDVVSQSPVTVKQSTSIRKWKGRPSSSSSSSTNLVESQSEAEEERPVRDTTNSEATGTSSLSTSTAATTSDSSTSSTLTTSLTAARATSHQDTHTSDGGVKEEQASDTSEPSPSPDKVMNDKRPVHSSIHVLSRTPTVSRDRASTLPPRHSPSSQDVGQHTPSFTAEHPRPPRGENVAAPLRCPSPGTPESLGGQSPITAASDMGASSFLPVEGSPFPSMMSAGSRLHYSTEDDVEKGNVSTGSRGRAGRRPHEAEELGEVIRHLLSQTSPSDLTPEDTKLLLTTIARQQSLIAQLSEQLRRSPLSASPVDAQAAPRRLHNPSAATPWEGSVSSMRGPNGATPTGVKRKAVSFWESSPTPPPVVRLASSQQERQPPGTTSEGHQPSHLQDASVAAFSVPPVLPLPLDGREADSASFPEPHMSSLSPVKRTTRPTAPYTASMIDRLCNAESGQTMDRSDCAPEVRLNLDPSQSVNRTLESLTPMSHAASHLDRSGGNMSRESLRAQLAELDMTASSRSSHAE